MAGEPFRESFLERIVNVSWQTTGGVFVSGDFCCFQRAVSIDRADSQQNWVGLGALAFTSGGGTFASTYASIGRDRSGRGGTPTFLIGGHDNTGRACLMRSNDGFGWTKMGVSHVLGADIYGLFWNENDQLFYLKPVDAGFGCSYSADGISWFVARDSFESYCNGVIPEVPDGVYGYNPSQDLVMFPGASSRDISAYHQLGIPRNPSVLYIISNASRGGDISATSIGGSVRNEGESGYVGWFMTDIYAVAYVGGIWMVGGGGSFGDQNRITMTASSINDGFDWFLSTVGDLGMGFPGDYIETMVGAPIRDFT